MSADTGDFIAARYHHIALPSAAPTESTTFTIPFTANGSEYKFEFVWNSKYATYSVNMKERSRGHIRKWYPQFGTRILVRGADPSSQTSRDMQVFFSSKFQSGITELDARAIATGEIFMLIVIGREVDF